MAETGPRTATESPDTAILHPGPGTSRHFDRPLKTPRQVHGGLFIGQSTDDARAQIVIDLPSKGRANHGIGVRATLHGEHEPDIGLAGFVEDIDKVGIEERGGIIE